MATIVYIVGARPNFVKMAPVLRTLRRRLPNDRHVLLHTGQHYDRGMSDTFFVELDVPEPDHFLGVGSASHAVQTARIMERAEPLLEAERPDLVLVPGDVNSTLAVTLVAAKLGLRVGHIESGLRSFDRSMPEEINRIVADEFSDLLFVHSDEAIDNLRAEGIADKRVHFVGNTMIDTLVAMEPRFRSAKMAERLGLTPGDYVLVTLHRPSLVDDSQTMSEVMRELSSLAREIPVIFPVHPRTAKTLSALSSETAVKLIEPLGYVDFLSLESRAAAVLTDSGGVQEETTHLGIPCFTLRDNTERPVTTRIGSNRLLGADPAAIGAVRKALGKPPKRYERLPGWDGNAAERIADVIGDPTV